MTTANLSVGIKTQQARQDLLELKSWMKKEMSGALSIDGAGLVKTIQSELSKLKVKINVDGAALKADVSRSLSEAFATTHRVNIDAVALAAQVRAAVSNGMAGGAGAPVVSAGAGAAPAAVSAALVPAIDRMVKSIEDAMHARAPRSQKAAPPVDVEADALAAARAGQADANRTFRFRRNWQQRNDETGWAMGPSREDMLRLRGQDQNRLDRVRLASAGTDARSLLGLPARDEMKTIGAQIAAQMRDGVMTEMLRAKSASGTDPRTLLGLPSRDEMKGLGSQIAAQMRDGVAAEALRTKSASGTNARTLLGLPSASEMSSFTASLRAQMHEAANATKLEMARAFESAKLDASRTHTGRGVSIAAAQTLASRFGDGPARDFLGSKAGLLDHVAGLRDYERGAGKAVGANRLLRESINDLHSAARGLAGSMGAMWATWGNTAPLVAFAALGATIRSVFVVGKELEFQLAFVKVLSDGTTVSLREFGDAVRGSMVAPIEAAQAMRALAQNGLSAKESLEALPAILHLAVAGEMSLAEAAYGATGVMAAFNLQVQDLGRVGDVFAKAAAVSNTSVKSMVEAMRQASTVGDQYHVTIEETAASLSVMAKRNIEGSAAGTAFRNMMVELATPTKKAKEAMASLGLELYDRNDQLKSFTDILGQLKDKTASLNEKSRLSFLNELFDERAAKAANALLSDYRLFGETLDTLKNKSEGFTKSVNDALAQTTEGKIKRLISEFQLSTSAAFEEVSTQVGNFVDQLRVAASSQEFRDFLKTITEGVISLSRFIVEHHEVIALTVGGWMALRAAMVMGGLFETMKVAIAGVTTGLVGMRAAALATVGALTGGIALVVALGVEYLLLRTHTDDATEAQRAFDNQIKLQNQTLDDSITKLKAENAQLELRVDLQRRGYSAEQAKKMAEEDTGVKDKGDLRDRARSDLAAAEARLLTAKGALDAAQSVPGSVLAVTAEMGVSDAQKQVNERRAALESAESAYTKFVEEQGLKRQRAAATEASERLRLANEFNAQLGEFRRKSGKDKELQGLFVTQGESQLGDRSSFDAMMSERRAALNKQGANWTARDTKAESQERRDQMAHSRQVIEMLRQEEAATKQQIKFSRELNEARYSASVYGPYMAAKVAEQESIKEIEALLQLEHNAVTKLNAEKKRAHLTDADRTNLDTEVLRRESSIKLMVKEIDHRKELLKLRQQERTRQGVVDEERTLRGLADKDAEQLNRMRTKYDTKVMPGADAAQREAELQVEERYRESITAKELKVKEAREGTLLLAEQIDLASGDELATLQERHATAQANLEVEMQRLQVMQLQATKAKEGHGVAARAEYDKSQTAEYGWQRFWKEYVEQGTSSANIVYNTMKTTTKGMEDAMVQFVMTGKLNFKSLVGSILAEVTRMMAAKVMQQFLNMVVNSLANSGGGGGTPVNGSAGSGVGTVYSANGNVMTQYGAMELRKYSKGGIAYRPQVSVFGEGSRPEAYVPLPDGRTIPVTMEGGGGGGVITNVTTNVHIHGDGKTESDSDVDGEKAGRLGKLIDTAVIAVINREMRNGGLLYNRQR